MRARKELNARLYMQKINEQNMPGYNDEAARYSEIQRGETEAVERKLESGELAFISDVRSFSEDIFRNCLYHFVLAASALARVCMEGGMGHDEAYTLSDIYIRKADKCRDIELVRKLFGEMCLDFAERMGEIRKTSVISLHIGKCIDHIYENLGSDLSVKALAKMSGLNPTYLSRLFSKETGVSLNRFVKEARVDTAQNLLLYSNLSYSEISATLGFSSQSSFIAVFKQITGVTPKVYRESFLKNPR